jgi:cytosine/adenosine deaminase-related metal-dependent hydrolase
MEAIQAATLNPAKYLGREKELGTIESGKLADLVLLDANPLVDIQEFSKDSCSSGERPLSQARGSRFDAQSCGNGGEVATC